MVISLPHEIMRLRFGQGLILSVRVKPLEQDKCNALQREYKVVSNVHAFLRAGFCAGFFMLTGTVHAEPQVLDEPIVIAHRGASGYRPEHTMASYMLGIEQGADYIEPDLVMTKDGVLVARHDVYLSSSTDVASRPEFADRKRILAGHDDWFVMDFTLAELETLRAKQAFPGRSDTFDGQFNVPTFDQIVELVRDTNISGRPLGLHIEMKRPKLFEQSVEPALVDILAERLNDLQAAGIPVFFQCFEGDFLKKIRQKTQVPLVFLVGGAPNPQTGWYELDIDLTPYYAFVDGFGLNKALVLKSDFTSSGLVEKLHDAGKLIHVWTVRNDAVPKGVASVNQELKILYSLPVDGVFTDFPDTAVSMRESMKLLSSKIK
jgi:glycerophosphoryl diester phosphodiesterase